jgi:hypothetical protein
VKIGAFVRNNIPEMQSYCESNPAELLKLMDATYSKGVFNLNWPFFAEAEKISPINRVRYWKDVYIIGGRCLRACSQWFDKDHEAFNRYLLSKSIVSAPISPNPPLPPTEPRGRFKATAVGDSQNSFIRVILSNLGQESFDQQHWEGTKRYFGGRCAYCDELNELYMDHGVPINKTSLGEHRLGNLIPCCKKCNEDKNRDDFNTFLRDQPERAAKIEAYMASRNYTPLGDNRHIKMIVEQAHKEVAALASRYIAIINTVLPGEADAL